MQHVLARIKDRPDVILLVNESMTVFKADQLHFQSFGSQTALHLAPQQKRETVFQTGAGS